MLKGALQNELRTIVYTQSRKMTELIAMWAASESGAFADRISAYRAGFLPEEGALSDEEIAGLHASYLASVKYSDRLVGEPARRIGDGVEVNYMSAVAAEVK